MKSIEITANSYAEALKEALEQLGLSENEVDAEKVKETGLLRKKVTVISAHTVIAAYKIRLRMYISCFEFKRNHSLLKNIYYKRYFAGRYHTNPCWQKFRI